MHHRLITIAALALALAGTTACKKKARYAPSCQRSVSLTAPWDTLKLPTSAGRVCASDADRAEIQYLGGTRGGWEQSYGDALVAAGFAKDRCTAQSCTYKRDAERATVQVIDARRWITVVVRR